MNLGIVIAVSEYGSPQNNLPGCRADGEAIAQILRTDSKFDDVLVIKDKTSSSFVKTELIRFISSHKTSAIEDLVFYFTGHGDFNGDEFYYLLTDYDKKKAKQTSLENSELDNLLKSLRPKNTIKIVDACHSGTPYIKDSEAFDTYLKRTQGEFDKCYFMFSSQTDQYSYQDNHLSFFTKSIVESIFKHESEVIRYKDIIDFVSDSFLGNSSQTPFFIVQADFTESFCSISPTLRGVIESLLKGDMQINPGGDAKQGKKLIDLVKEDAARYCTEEEAQKCVQNFIEVLGKVPIDSDVSEFYDVTVDELNDYSEIPSQASIGKWLDSNENNFFAKSVSEEFFVTKRVPKDPAQVTLGGLSVAAVLGGRKEEDYKTVTQKEMRVRGFKSTVDFPIKLVKINANSRFPNLDFSVAYVVPLVSKTDMRVFYSFNQYNSVGWDGKVLQKSAKWLTEMVGLKDVECQVELAKKIISEFSGYIYEPIERKFGAVENKTDE